MSQKADFEPVSLPNQRGAGGKTQRSTATAVRMNNAAKLQTSQFAHRSLKISEFVNFQGFVLYIIKDSGHNKPITDKNERG
jgi:hypothetical protein